RAVDWLYRPDAHCYAAVDAASSFPATWQSRWLMVRRDACRASLITPHQSSPVISWLRSTAYAMPRTSCGLRRAELGPSASASRRLLSVPRFARRLMMPGRGFRASHGAAVVVYPPPLPLPRLRRTGHRAFRGAGAEPLRLWGMDAPLLLLRSDPRPRDQCSDAAVDRHAAAGQLQDQSVQARRTEQRDDGGGHVVAG